MHKNLLLLFFELAQPYFSFTAHQSSLPPLSLLSFIYADAMPKHERKRIILILISVSV
jgi:hypothetical protein